MTSIYFLNKQITAKLVAAVTVVSLLMSALPVAFFVALADTVGSIDFESGYSVGSIHTQDGWLSTGAYDQGVTDVSALALTELGTKAFRISNAVTSGAFGDQTFVKPLTDSVGEVDATNGTFSPGSKKNTFEMEFDFTSASPSAQQPGLFISVSPDRGDGSRMSYLGFEDVTEGIKVNFFDVQGAAPGTFTPTVIGTYNRNEVHTIKLVMTVVDGPSNDIVKVYVDGSLVHTGTSWEDYFRLNPESAAEQSPRIVKTAIFRAGGASVPANDDKGFLFDNLSLKSSDVVAPPKPTLEVDVTGNTAAGENQMGWMFGRDITTATPFAFTNAQASIGTGSLYAGPITNTNFGGVPANNPDKDKFIAEYFPGALAVADFDGLDYDFRIGSGGDAADANQFYVNVYTNTDNLNGFYDCRYDYAVTAASTGVFNTVSIDPSDTPTNVATRGTSELQPCPTTLAAMPAGSHIRAFAINVGDTSASDAGLDAYLDKVVLDTTSLITTFDFEPIPTCELVIKSDTVDFVEEKNALAKALTFVHNAWLQAIPSSAAEWIWGDNPVTDTTVAETQTFVKKFNWTGGTPTSATLKIASDNGHAVTLGSFVGGNTVGNTFAATTDYNVASAIVAGENILEIAVTNLATPNDPNPQNNPAGLIYELVIEGTGESCGAVTPITPVVNATLEITDPVANNDFVSGIYDFKAQYVDNDMTVDNIQWAIRTGASCNANTGTVAGNVDGFSDASTFVGTNFVATLDTSSFAPGQYCFVVNPQEQIGESDLRATRLFMIEEPPARDVTICKYDDTDEQNPLYGWQLSLLGGLVDTVTVPANAVGGANTDVPLDGDESYVAVATGTWINSGQGLNFVDAEYSTVNNWVTPVDGFTGYSEDILELQINSTFDPASDWGPYNSMHRYAQGFSPAADGPANFRVFDGSGETPNAGWYGDNQGTLEVNVYEGWTGVTSEDGCVTFENVPYGTYQIDEVQQDNWENVSGLGTVEINGEPQSFGVVNRDTTIPLTCELNIKSGVSTVLDTYGNAVTTYDNHPSWTANIPGSAWIWSDFYVTTPLGSEEHIFTETFTATNVSSALLDVAADNTYKVYVNDVLVPELDRQNENNYASHTQKNDVDISSYLIEGENTIRFEVTNLPLQGGNQITNPAGLLFNLDIIAESDCAVTTEPEPEPVDVCPNLEGSQESIPEGYEKVGESSSCTPIPVVVDVCSNLEGNQTFIPEGYEKISESNECTLIPQITSRDSNNGGGTRTGLRNAPSGQVLGASTMQCGMLLDTYMKMGQDNDQNDVMQLQWFLIGQGYTLSATGVFDAATDAAVRAFQEANRADVLTPWVTAGILKVSNPTGWVYQLTRWKINNIVCPGSEAAPVLLP